MRARMIINLKSGSLLDGSSSELEQQLVDTFAAGGHALEIVSIEPDDLDRAITDAKDSDADTVIMAGGDGTLRAGAAAMIDTDKTLGVIPLGTFNRLAREIGLPIEPIAAARALTLAKAEKIDVARVNGRLFLCNSLIGLPPYFSRQRQELRDQPFGDRVAGYSQVIRSIIRSRRRLDLTVDKGGDVRRLRVLSLAVSNNPYSEKPGFGLFRPALNTGRFGVYISKHRSGLELLWVFLRATCGVWRGDPALEISTAKQIKIDANRSKILVSNDGEVERLEAPLQYEIIPRTLSFLLPVTRAQDATSQS